MERVAPPTPPLSSHRTPPHAAPSRRTGALSKRSLFAMLEALSPGNITPEMRLKSWKLLDAAQNGRVARADVAKHALKLLKIIGGLPPPPNVPGMRRRDSAIRLQARARGYLARRASATAPPTFPGATPAGTAGGVAYTLGWTTFSGIG